MGNIIVTDVPKHRVTAPHRGHYAIASACHLVRSVQRYSDPAETESPSCGGYFSLTEQCQCRQQPRKLLVVSGSAQCDSLI